MLGLSVRGQNATSAGNENSLDAARRDLRALPATEHSQDILGKSSGLGSAGLPALTLPGESVKPQTQSESSTPASATWLQDALKQTDVERGQRRSSFDAADTREQTKGYQPAAAPDPMGKYLEQWLSPRDLELLRPDPRKNAEQNSGGISSDKTPPRSGMPGVSTTQTRLEVVPIMPMTQNPYLVEPNNPSSAAPTNPYAPAAPFSLPQNDLNRLPTTQPLPASTGAPRQTVPAKPTHTPSESLPKPPTAPIVDDQKYFPQLRRF